MKHRSQRPWAEGEEVLKPSRASTSRFENGKMTTSACPCFSLWLHCLASDLLPGLEGRGEGEKGTVSKLDAADKDQRRYEHIEAKIKIQQSFNIPTFFFQT